MIIRAKRINNVLRHMGAIPVGTQVIVGLPLDGIPFERLQKLGFPNNPDVNLALLPPPIFGPTSAFNANGTEIIHYDKPLETVYRSVYSTWNDWHGDPHSGYVNRPYRRRPRTFVPPPAVEVRTLATVTGETFIATPRVAFETSNLESIKHRVNLLLEIFGHCEVVTENLERIIEAPIKRLNWRFLPPGVRPFEQLREEVRPLIERARRGEQPVITRRLEVINSYQPDFVAIGEFGFAGYLVFGFQTKGLFLFESIFFGNATYVFGENWKHLSQLTKAEILDRNLAQDRVVHRDSWDAEMHRLLR